MAAPRVAGAKIARSAAVKRRAEVLNASQCASYIPHTFVFSAQDPEPSAQRQGNNQPNVVYIPVDVRPFASLHAEFKFECTQCGVTNTTQTRSGPMGPGTLCNRCELIPRIERAVAECGA